MRFLGEPVLRVCRKRPKREGKERRKRGEREEDGRVDAAGDLHLLSLFVIIIIMTVSNEIVIVHLPITLYNYLFLVSRLLFVVCCFLFAVCCCLLFDDKPSWKRNIINNMCSE